MTGGGFHLGHSLLPQGHSLMGKPAALLRASLWNCPHGMETSQRKSWDLPTNMGTHFKWVCLPKGIWDDCHSGSQLDWNLVIKKKIHGFLSNWILYSKLLGGGADGTPRGAQGLTIPGSMLILDSQMLRELCLLLGDQTRVVPKVATWKANDLPPVSSPWSISL